MRGTSTGRRRLGAPLATLLVVMATTACASRPEPFDGSPTRGQMITHFDLALDAREFAIVGSVDDFQRTVEDLADLNPARELPDAIILQLGPMRWEAREAARAGSVQEAAVGAARIAETCGDCHEANGVGLGERFTLGGPPPAGSTGRHMAGLAWASRLLWDGLVGPSDRTWYVGAEGLIELGALPDGLEGAVPRSTTEEFSAHLRYLGRRAVVAETAEARVEILGEIWATCADCHTRDR
ncbi:MAG: hypothetical protein HKN72_10385 [Gemmatimonadetes bacterium]|nr:hypothetical protein [Gemmatimonadota bacterium]